MDSDTHNQACESDDDGAADEVDEAEEELQMARIRSCATQGRRQSRCTESIDEEKINNYVKPVYEKSDETKSLLRDALINSSTLQALTGSVSMSVIDDIVNAFQATSAKEGEVIITQGDDGDCLYIISSGTVDIFVRRQDDSPSLRGPQVASLGAGAVFGELALLYTTPRAATAVIISPECELWRLRQEDFKMLLVKFNAAKYRLYEGWLHNVPILGALNDYELSRLSEAMESELFDEGEVIIEQGAPGDKFYILEEGCCEAYIKTESGEHLVKRYDTQGDYFGEIALINNTARRATIRACADGAAVASVAEDVFTNLLGPLREILAEDIDKYTSPKTV